MKLYLLVFILLGLLICIAIIIDIINKLKNKKMHLEELNKNKNPYDQAYSDMNQDRLRQQQDHDFNDIN
ncbi:hypothetical protein [Chengkuizengella marina]|uniref:Uncharacterized protein n=1 Tax=Chengkuizengella marina TaxID=2507566 RepID=A0A6N9Q906_9BACL|nr:hypothetical protein [Chengkuizengella marina]NBI31113.1 hypothetical protein [Chengkuizengella marina]